VLWNYCSILEESPEGENPEQNQKIQMTNQKDENRLAPNVKIQMAIEIQMSKCQNYSGLSFEFWT